MRKKKIITFLIIFFILIFQLKIFSVSKQELGIVQLREDGYAYKVKNINVFKVVEYLNNVKNFNNDIYCIRAGPGFGGTITEPTTRLTYTFTYNLKEKSNIPSNYLSSLPTDTNITKQIQVNGETKNITYTNYNALLWLLDNIYLPKSENATQKREILLKNAFAEQLNDTSLIPPFTLDQINLTDSDLEVVQQLAIWHFTNAGDSKYDMGESLPAIQISEKNNTANYNGYDMDSGRQDDAQTLYKYLINNAMINANKYGSGDVRELSAPINLVQNKLKTEYTSSNVIVGPFKIEKKSELPYNISTQVVDQSNKTINNYSLLKENNSGDKVNVESGKTIADLVGENFYISVPKGNGVTGLKLKINCEYYKTEAILGVVEGDTSQQPLVKLTDKLITYEQENSIDYNFDLALRKFITGLNGSSITNRVPQVTVSENKITYNHTKDPVVTSNGDLVEYTIRIYNEGTVSGYAESIKDDIPEGLEFVEDNEINKQYGWVKTGNSITTDYLSKEKGEDNIINAFGGTVDTLYYKDVKVVFKVIEPNTSDRTLINTAEINDDSDENGNEVDDVDSVPGNGLDGEDDIDKEYIVVKYFDLALRKFITGLNESSITNRVPQVTVSGNKVTYNHTKDPVVTSNGDLVEYTIRVYNEGSIAGYAESIKDDIPEGLEFVEDNEINKQYGWVKTGNSITTDYLSKEKGIGNIIEAFDRESMQEPAYKDVKVVFKVIEPNTSDKTLINTAEINEDYNKYGKPDVDSTPGNGTEGEDDIDKEYVVVRYFDLALRKFITGLNGSSITNRVPQVTVSGDKITYNHTKESIVTTNGDLVEYTIRVYNEGSIAGYAESIKDDIPEGLEFVEDNEINKQYGWVKTGNSITTDYLSKEKGIGNIIEAFDRESMQEPAYKDVKVVFKVIEPNTSDKTLINTAEINEDYNEYDKPDIDSTPGNGTEGEDDIDKEYVVVKYFDLALRKFITGLNDIKTDSRVPQITIDNSTRKITYNHTKDPVITSNGDLVEYTIRIYNEGSIAGYAESIKDDIPEGLEFVEDNEINKQYGWVKTGNSITTDYLSKEKGEDNIINAFGGTVDTLYYKDVKVVFKVIEPNTSDRTLINTAEINDDSDENGNEVDDVDSVPGNGLDGEDDIDKEYVVVRYFDLALRKFITGVNGTNTDSRVPQVVVNEDTGEITYNHTKDPVVTSNGDLVEYTIRVYNEGTVSGYAESIKDDIPEGLEFVEDNEINKQYGWVKTGNSITTDYLSKDRDVNNIISAFDRDSMQEPVYKDVKVVFRVIEPNTSDRTLINTAEINEDSNEYDMPDVDSVPGNGLDGEDDIDKEYVVVRYFDLSLRKFITGVNGETTDARVPQVIVNEDTGEITYNHTKEPVITTNGDLVEYTIRVYNEGTVAGYAESIKDDIPEGLEFVEDNKTNIEYGWVKTGDSITTDYLSKDRDVNNIIPAFDRDSMQEPEYKEVKVVFKVIEPNTSDRTLINTAEINEDSNEYDMPDVDSVPGNGLDGEDDIDKEYVVVRYFDLALRKFITQLNDEEITNRVPQVVIDEEGKITYNHTKEPVLVANSDIVVYTIRVYNEGSIAGYAESIKDDIPQGLEFVEDNEINIEYGWVKTGDSITTDYLSEDRDVNNIIQAFDRDTMTEPAYKEVKVVFRVTEEMLPSDRILINTAEINEDGNEYNTPDEDSVPGNGIEGEDDIDKEYVRVQYFDLSLLKWVNKVIITENGVTTEQDTGHTGLEQPEPVVKVDLDRKNLDNITVKFEYTIKITNEGQIAGYAKEISDYIPEGLEFLQEDNPNWTVEGDKIITRQLENTLLQPGETAEVKVILTWKKDPDNMGVKINIAEISEDYNEKGAHDIDSTPDNQVEGEDDIDDAPVALSIKTGQNRIYFTLIGIILVTIAGGIVLIKRYVL